MLKINYMSTLFVGIDVSSKTNAVYAMDFEENKYISSSFGNNQPGADKLVNMIAECMQKHKNLDTLLIVLESTSVYSVHISNFLSTSEVDLCQYFGQKKSKDYAAFLSSSSSFCCGVK